MLPHQLNESPLRPIDGTEMFSPTGGELKLEGQEEDAEPAGDTAPEFPMPWRMACKYHSDSLTDLERQEIVGYPEVYFVGQRSHKPGSSAAAQNNHGLDDENGNYKLFPNDQIAFRYQVQPLSGVKILR